MTHPLFTLIGYIEQDLRGIHSKLTMVRAQLAAMNLPDGIPRFECPRCGIGKPSEAALKDHLALIHDTWEPISVVGNVSVPAPGDAPRTDFEAGAA